MAKRVFIVRALVDGYDYSEYRHLTLEVNIAEVKDAAREVSAAVKQGWKYEIESCQERLAGLIASGRKTTVYYSAPDSNEVTLRWQADREKGWKYWYSFRCSSVAMDVEALAVLRKLSQVLEKAGAMGQWSATPAKVWEALKAAGAVLVDWNNGASALVESAEVPDFLLPVEESSEVSEAA